MKLEFSDSDLMILNDALVNMPYKVVIELINSINKQISKQQTKSEVNPSNTRNNK